MRVTSITVTAGRKINLGNYEQASMDVCVTAELDADEDSTTALAELWTAAKTSLKEQTAPFLKKRQEQVDAVYDGLPADVQEHINANSRPHG